MTAVVDTQSLRKEYGALVAVRDVELRIEKGEVLGLVGPNGAGKTTLLRMLATLIRPTRGTAQVLGHDILRDYLDVRRRIGFMPDFFNLYNDLTLEECLTFFSSAYRVPKADIPARVSSALEYVKLEAKRGERIGHLSRGMTQRLGVACMLVHDPDLLLLDEPASGLDPQARIQLRTVLHRLASDGKTVVISSHILTELDELCSDLCIMDRGRIVERGSVSEITTKAAGATQVEATLRKPDPGAVEVACALAFAAAATLDGNVLLVTMPDGPEELAALNRALVAAGIDVIGLATREHSLESVFMEIAQREGVDHDG